MAKSAPPGESLPAADAREVADPDPIEAIYPPLVGELGREYHGKDHEHDAETIARHRSGPDALANTGRAPGPLARPERLYLHYLLLHMDRLSDTALVYLGHALETDPAAAHPRVGSDRTRLHLLHDNFEALAASFVDRMRVDLGIDLDPDRLPAEPGCGP